MIMIPIPFKNKQIGGNMLANRYFPGATACNHILDSTIESQFILSAK